MLLLQAQVALDHSIGYRITAWVREPGFLQSGVFSTVLPGVCSQSCPSFVECRCGSHHAIFCALPPCPGACLTWCITMYRCSVSNLAEKNFKVAMICVPRRVSVVQDFITDLLASKPVFYHEANKPQSHDDACICMRTDE